MVASRVTSPHLAMAYGLHSRTPDENFPWARHSGEERVMGGRTTGRRWLPATAVAVALCAWASAETVVFDNGMAVNTGGATSDADAENPAYTGRQVADDFVLASGASTVGGVEWVGGYVAPDDGNDPGAYGLRDRFTIVIFFDDEGVPGGVVARYEAGHASRTPAGDGVWSYRYDFPAPLPLRPDTPYHLAIFNRVPGTGYWCWAITGAPGRSHSSAINPVQWYEWPQDCAFRLLKAEASPRDRRALPLVVGCVLGVLALRRYVL